MIIKIIWVNYVFQDSFAVCECESKCVFSTVIIIAIFLAIVIIAPSSFEFLTQQLKQWITDSFSWFYVLSVAVFLILLIYIACSDSGKIKLGPDHSQPEYKNGSWFAMLFTAGMGIGLMFLVWLNLSCTMSVRRVVILKVSPQLNKH